MPECTVASFGCSVASRNVSAMALIDGRMTGLSTGSGTRSPMKNTFMWRPRSEAM